MGFRITKNNSESFLYKQHAWKIYVKNGSKPITRYLTKSFKYVETMLMHYSKVFMVRFDLSPNQFNQTNKHIQSYLNQLEKGLSERYQCQCRYICAREQKSSSKEHYHIVLFLSGHKIQYPNSLFKRIKQGWQCFDEGTIHWPERCYYMLKRGQKHTIEKAIYRLSYLTKTDSKELNPKGISSLIFSPLSIPEEINKGTNDIMLVDARYNPPLSKIRVTPLLYACCKTYPKGKKVKTSKKNHVFPSRVSKSILNCQKQLKNNKRINLYAHQVDQVDQADQASAPHEPKIDPL